LKSLLALYALKIVSITDSKDAISEASSGTKKRLKGCSACALSAWHWLKSYLVASQIWGKSATGMRLLLQQQPK